MTYSPLERRLLSHYFSVVDPAPHADIYLVRNLPPETAATLNGVYSRSPHSMRDNFLQRLRKGLEETGRTLEDLDVPEPVTKDWLGEILADKSGQFLKTYAIDHGHNSLREGSWLHLAIENVSQLVTRFVQRERRCSFEESSTRYISFSKEGHWRDPEVVATGGEVARAYESVLGETFALYNELLEALPAHLRTVRPPREGEKPAAYERALRAESFDAARYLLTPALFTKWGMVADARTVADVVSELASHPLAEFRIVGDRIKAQADTTVRTLLTHAKPNAALQAQHTTLRRLALALGAREPSAPEGRPSVRLLAWDRDLDSRLLASLLYEQASLPFERLLAKVAALPPVEREALFQNALAARGPRDPLPFALEGAQPFDFEILVDFGAYRDIGRHRKGVQMQQALTVEHGYAVPPLVRDAGLAERYCAVLDRAARAQQVVANAHPLAAGYVTPFAFLQRARLVFDPRQVGYFVELRSGPEGHFSYRQIALEMLALVRDRAPLFAKFIRACEDPVLLGRLHAEQNADERRARRMHAAGDA